jgi:hypothetical protein
MTKPDIGNAFFFTDLEYFLLELGFLRKLLPIDVALSKVFFLFNRKLLPFQEKKFILPKMHGFLIPPDPLLPVNEVISKCYTWLYTCNLDIKNSKRKSIYNSGLVSAEVMAILLRRVKQFKRFSLTRKAAKTYVNDTIPVFKSSARKPLVKKVIIRPSAATSDYITRLLEQFF